MPDPRNRGEIDGTDGVMPCRERSTPARKGNRTHNEQAHASTHPDKTYEPRRGD